MPSIEGYAIVWDEKEQSEVTTGEILLYCTVPLLSVLALLVMISVGNVLFDWIHENAKDKANYLYLYFWSAQLLAFVAIVMGVYVLAEGGLGAVFGGIYIAMIIEAIIASVIVLRRKEFIPVPLICCCASCYSNNIICQKFTNALAFATTFAFLTYLLYSIPSILLAFYVFPSQTIVKLSFINFAVIVLLIVVSLFLFSLEKFCCLCFCKRKTERDPEGGAAPSASLIPLEHIRDGSLSTDIDPSDNPADGICPSLRNISMVLVRLVTALLIIIVAIILLLVIGAVVFEQTLDGKKDINEYQSFQLLW